MGDRRRLCRCNDCTASVDAHIEVRLPIVVGEPDMPLLSVQLRAGLPMATVRANVKLAISCGQNEPRDAIAGTAWALLTHPDQPKMVPEGRASWRIALEECAGCIPPIGMPPRRVAREDTVDGVDFEPESRVFFMFGSGNRDDDVFGHPDVYGVTRDTARSVAIGAGPHFCAGAAASGALVAAVVLPTLFERFPDLCHSGDVEFAGWTCRGPSKVPVAWCVASVR